MVMKKRLYSALILVLLFVGSTTAAHASTRTVWEDMDKITFRVDMRNQTVAANGVFIAGDFLSQFGYPDWSFVPMCSLGNGEIWEISFSRAPRGRCL